MSLDSFDESFGTLYKCASARTSSGCNSLGSRTNVSCACLYPLRIAIKPKTNISIMQELRRSRTRTSVCDWPFVPIVVGSNRQRGFRERLFLVPFAVNAVRTGIYLRRRMKKLCLYSKKIRPTMLFVIRMLCIGWRRIHHWRRFCRSLCWNSAQMRSVTKALERILRQYFPARRWANYP